jgi:1-aminocyclopropane-1-carboxylate deaminase/D-cysteine desulfhydrase-like pyridoxal-dependent ACC family enzyme
MDARSPTAALRHALAGLPRFPLLGGRSPLQPLPRFSKALGGDVDVWAKREDLLPVAFGGNKLRNLEFLVGEALAGGSDALVTSGRRWSNHCRLTAAAGAMAGLEVHLVLSGPPVERDGPNIEIERLLGAHIHVAPTGDRADRAALVERITQDLREGGRRPFVIEVGGTGVTGAVGQLLAGLELHAQSLELGLVPSIVVVPSATGGTQAGILAGLRLAGSPARVAGVSVARPSSELAPVVERLVTGLAGLIGRDIGEPIELDDAFLEPGYGRPNSAAEEAARLLARTEGVLVDPIYTAKALAWLVAAAPRGDLSGQSVVFWHAGGTPGLFEALDTAG